jgi:zinc transport system substrate-binding protein
MTTSRRALLTMVAVSVASLGSAAVADDTGSVVVSIKPLHSLVANVMAGVGEPVLILSGGGSEHTYSLRPSEAAALEQARVVFWVGEGLETFLADTIAAVAGKATVVELGEAEGVTRLPTRTGATWDPHGDEHAEDAHAGEQAEDEHAEDGHAEHEDEHGSFDPHVWLDPVNAQALVTAIAATLAEADPEHADAFRANEAETNARLAELDAELAAVLAPVADKPFIVFHDGYQYLERRYGLAGAGSITVSPEVQPGAARVQEIRERIEELGAVCVFAEPQFAPALVETAIEGSDARTAVLDTLGAELENGPELYFQLMRANAQALSDCLGAE